MEALGMLLWVLFIFAAVMFSWGRQRRQREEIAERLRLRRESSTHLTGLIGDMGLDMRFRDGKGAYTEIKLWPRMPLPEGMTIKREDLGSMVSKLLVGKDLEIGDPQFDGRFNLRGPVAQILAMLNAEARAALLPLAPNGSVAVEHGGLRVRYSGSGKAPDDVIRIVEHMHRVVAAMAPNGQSVGARLRYAVQIEGDPNVRRLMARTLLTHPEGSQFAEELASDGDPWVRVAAALALGYGGTARLLAIATDESLVAGVRVEAIRPLGRRRADGVIDALERASLSEEPEVVRAALEALAAQGVGPSVEQLAGGLAIAAPEGAEGGLSAPAEAGSVSFGEPAIAEATVAEDAEAEELA